MHYFQTTSGTMNLSENKISTGQVADITAAFKEEGSTPLIKYRPASV